MTQITHGEMPGATTPIEKAAGATNSNGLHTDTNYVNFRTNGAINQAHDGKAIADQIARLALAGHVVKNSMARYGADFAALAAFGWQLAGNVIRSFIQTLSYWLIQSAPYSIAILMGVTVGVLA